MKTCHDIALDIAGALSISDTVRTTAETLFGAPLNVYIDSIGTDSASLPKPYALVTCVAENDAKHRREFSLAIDIGITAQNNCIGDTDDTSKAEPDENLVLRYGRSCSLDLLLEAIYPAIRQAVPYCWQTSRRTEFSFDRYPDQGATVFLGLMEQVTYP